MGTGWSWIWGHLWRHAVIILERQLANQDARLSRIWQFEPTGNSFPCLENKVLRRKKWKPVFIFLVGHFTKADFRETCLFSVWLCFSCCIYKVYLNNNKDKIFLNVRANSTRSVKEKILFVFVSEAHHVDLCWLSYELLDVLGSSMTFHSEMFGRLQGGGSSSVCALTADL